MFSPATVLTLADLAKAIVPNPLTIAPDARVVDAIALMSAGSSICNFICEIDPASHLQLSQTRRSCVLVIENDRPVGIVTERDLVRLSAAGLNLAEVAIADVMSSPVITLKAANFTDIFVPLSLFQHHPIRHLPLMDEQDRVVGLLTHDSLRQLLTTFDLLHLLTTADVMTQVVVHAPPTATLAELTQLISTHRVSSVVIINNTGTHLIPVGIVTERHIVQLLSLELDFVTVLAETIMSMPVVSVNADISLWVVQQLMQERQINQVVITNNEGNLLGIVTQTSLLSVLNPMAIYGLVERLVQERTSRIQKQVAREKLLTQIATQIRASLNLSEVLDAAVTAVRGFLQCDRLLVYQFQPDWSGIVVAESVGEGWRASLHDMIDDPCFRYQAAVLYRDGKMIAIDNIYTYGYPECYLNLLEQYQVKAKLVVSILVSGQLWGLLIGHQCAEYRCWQEADLTLLDEIAVQLAIAIQQATAYQQVQTELAERQRTEAALRASEERFRKIIETTLEGVWIIDTQNCTSYVNPRMAEMLGYTIDEMLGKTLFDFMDTEAQVQAHIYLERRRQGIQEQHDFRFQTKTGRDVWTLISTNPLYDDAGTYIGSLGMLTDISDRKVTESMLRQYERVVSATTDGIALLDCNYVYRLVNYVYLDRYEKSQEEIVGHSVKELLGKTVFETLVQPCLERCLTGEIQQHEAWFEYQNGARRFVRVTYSPYIEQDGKITGVVVSTHDLTAIKQAEEALEQLNQDLERRVQERTAALQASEERWQLALKGANDGIWDWDFKNNKIFFSSRWKQMRGFTDDEIGDSPDECLSRIHPDDYDCVMAAVDNHFGGRTEFFEVEYRTQRKDGSYMWVLDRAQALRDESGQVIRMSGSETDITQRKLAEAALRESERRYATLAAAAPVAIFRFDQPLNCVYVNDRWSEMTGRPKASALGQGWIASLHPDERDELIAQWSGELIQVTPGDITLNHSEGRHLRPDGSINWFYVQVAQEIDVAGKVIGYIGTLTDITDRKRLEQEQNRLIAILEASTDYILIADLEGTVIWSNSSLKRMRGQDGNVPSKQKKPIDYHPQWAVELLEQQAVPAAIANGSWLGENVLLDAQGQEIPVSQLLLAHKSPQGKVEFFSTIMRDMRVHKEYEQRLERTNAELLRATRLKDEFLANMSHELRTPLNAILGMSESLLEEVLGELNNRQQQAIATIERSGEHLLGLINDILEISKIEAGKLELDISTVAISQLCKSSLTFVRQQALKKQIQLHMSLPPHLGEIAVDERRIRQVLINLLTNAIKFTPIGGRVTLEAHYEPIEVNLAERVPIIRSHGLNLVSTPDNCPPGCGYYLCISVIDTGIGIAPADQAKLFQPFVQVDSSLNRKYEGTGLGLALVKRIIELHGGDVSLRSELNQGSCFTVRLPYTCQVADRSTLSLPLSSHSVAIAPPEVVAAPSSVHSPLILLAEDNEANVSTISSYLEAKGYRILVANNGEEAINLTQTHRPDLILMDIQMPGVNGLQAIEKIRQNHQLASIPIIALTALAMTGDREKCLASGATDYLAKPVQLKQLAATIQQLLLTNNTIQD